MGVLSRPLNEVNGLLASGKGVSKAVRYSTLESFAQAIAEIAEMVGCFGQDPDAWLLSRRDGKAARIGLDIEKVEQLLVDRIAAREAKDWSEADRIRDDLSALGVGVQDGPTGSIWSFL